MRQIPQDVGDHEQVVPDDHDRESVTALHLAEYSTVRDEWLSSRAAQQQTFQWSLAGISVLLAALVTANTHRDHSAVYVLVATAAIVLAVASQAIWLGELMRMERAALFLRGLEKIIRETLRDRGAATAMLWETWRASRPARRDVPWVGVAGPTVIGGFVIYNTTIVAAIAVLVLAAQNHALVHALHVFAVCASALAAVAYCGLTAYTFMIFHQLASVRRSAADLADYAEHLAARVPPPCA